MQQSITDEFVQAVADMRDKQRQYFKARTQSALIASKDAERRVDDLLSKWQATRQKEAGQLELL